MTVMRPSSAKVSKRQKDGKIVFLKRDLKSFYGYISSKKPRILGHKRVNGGVTVDRPC